MDLETHVQGILDDYVAKLEALGTPDAIALHLQGRGVRAFCAHGHRCALAEDLREAFRENDVAVANIGVSGVSIWVDGDEFEVRSRQPSLPPVVRGFMGDFDHGHYPELIHPADANGQRVAQWYAVLNGVRRAPTP